MIRSLLTLITLTVAGSIFLSLALNTQAFAALEKYHWVDYQTIGAFDGVYNYTDNSSDGGVFQATFIQDKDDPTKFVAESIGEQCENGMTITVEHNSKNITVEGSADCNLINGADIQSEVKGKNTAIATAEQEQRDIHDAYIAKACEAAPILEKIKCESSAKDKSVDQRKACQLTHDYKKSPHILNSYLNCVADALTIDRTTLGEDDTDDAETEKPEDQCEIADIGWIVCQITDFIAIITDQTFSLIQPFLETPPVIATTPSNGSSTIYTAWKTFRNLANVLFVVLFLVIIYSQIANKGVNSYGIKKITPRLVIAAVLVNISFFACSMFVDLSNIMGKTVQSVFIEFSDTAPPSVSDRYKSWKDVTKRILSITANDKDFNEESLSKAEIKQRREEEKKQKAAAEARGEEPDLLQDIENHITEMTISGISYYGSAVLYANLSVLVPVMIAALIAMVVALLVLLMRQALIIILIAIAPIACICYVLPNTKSWFDRWRKVFMQMMILYPAIAIIFGGSTLASRIVQDSAINNGQTLLAIFSLGIQVIPLFITPLLMKISGGALNRFAGIVKKREKGLSGGLRKWGNEFRADKKGLRESRAARNSTASNPSLISRKKRGYYKPKVNQMLHQKGYDSAPKELDKAKKEYFGDTQSPNAPSRARAGDIAEKTTRGLSSEDAKAEIERLTNESIGDYESLRLERVRAIQAKIVNDGVKPSDYFNAAETGVDHNNNTLNDDERSAYTGLAASIASVEEAERLVLVSSSVADGTRRELVEKLRSNGISKKAPQFGGSALGQVEAGQIRNQTDIDNLTAKAANGQKFSAEAMSNASPYTLSKLRQVTRGDSMANIPVSDTAKNQMQRAAGDTLGSRKLMGNVKEPARVEINRISKGMW